MLVHRRRGRESIRLCNEAMEKYEAVPLDLSFARTECFHNAWSLMLLRFSDTCWRIVGLLPFIRSKRSTASHGSKVAPVQEAGATGMIYSPEYSSNMRTCSAGTGTARNGAWRLRCAGASNMYPKPGSLRMCVGCSGSGSSLRRSRRMYAQR
jgi:hypothetical protein